MCLIVIFITRKTRPQSDHQTIRYQIIHPFSHTTPRPRDQRPQRLQRLRAMIWRFRDSLESLDLPPEYESYQDEQHTTQTQERSLEYIHPTQDTNSGSITAGEDGQ
jgi:hypothetical protein